MTHINTQALCSHLQYTFKSKKALQQALTHRSFGTPHNERLEFLGDAVLNLVIADALLKRYPDLPEGKLSPMRAALVKGETLACIAKELSLNEYLLLGPGEIKTKGAHRTSILADALEAIFGAIFLDGGFTAAEAAILHVYHARLEAHNAKQAANTDFKTALQEYLHAHKIPLPTYRLIQTKGAAHTQTFHVTCSIDTLNISKTGQGPTRRKAEQMAASALLKHLKK
ncbi:MAG: ribonuclease III [Legionellaceae bacterium]|nr:ribonuclease III [Legionellaceae bacterium]